MEHGDIGKTVAMIGDIAMSDDAERAVSIRTDMIREVGMADPNVSVKLILGTLDSRIGYFCGCLGPELGNKALALFNVRHPYFGTNIPTDLRDAMEMGNKYAKEYAKKLQLEQERARKVKRGAELGVMIPESDETIDSSTARKLLLALRAEKDPKAAAEMLAKYKAKDEAAAKAALDAEIAAMAEEESLDEDMDPEYAEKMLKAGPSDGEKAIAMLRAASTHDNSTDETGMGFT